MNIPDELHKRRRLAVVEMRLEVLGNMPQWTDAQTKENDELWDERSNLRYDLGLKASK